MASNVLIQQDKKVIEMFLDIRLYSKIICMAKNLSFSPTLCHVLALIALLLGSGRSLIRKKTLHFFHIKYFRIKSIVHPILN